MKMKKNHGEITVNFEKKLEMTDCKYFRYIEIQKGLGTDNVKTLQIPNCLVGIGGIDGCPKYCPLYETK